MSAAAAAAVQQIGGRVEITPSHSGWLPLKITSGLANTVDDIDRNIEYALDLNLPPLQSLMGMQSGAVAIVGSGPSLKANWHKLKRFKGDILACNAACQFLLERGIVPKYMMCFDADPLVMKFLERTHKDVTYLLASRCPPQIFDALKDHKVVCWHAAGDEHIADILDRRKRAEPMVMGGTAAVTRAMILVAPLGYTEQHIFGADSSFANDGNTHIRESTTVEKRMPIMCNKKIFECAPWMAQQAEDFKKLAPVLMNVYGTRLHVYGTGLIPEIALALGCRTDLMPKVEQLWREWKWKATTLWANI